MFASLGLAWLGVIFVLAGAVVWVAGLYVSDTVDVLSGRFGIGQAMGGVVVLAVVTNLPEIAITLSASLHGHVDLATGNLLGGIAVQTLVMVALDRFGVGRTAALTRRAASLALALEGVLVMAVLAVVVMGSQLPAVTVGRVSPGAAAIVVVWLVGVWLLGRADRGLPWTVNDADAGAGPKGHSKAKKQDKAKRKSTARTLWVFALAAAATLAGGVGLEAAGDAIADKIGMTGMLFGATVLAAATSLPELSTGLASIRLGDDKLAVSDIFGGNAFLPVLFLLATLASGRAVLPTAGRANLYLTGLGAAMTAVYVFGLVMRPKRQVGGVGVDSLVVLVVYACGVAGLVMIVKG